MSEKWDTSTQNEGSCETDLNKLCASGNGESVNMIREWRLLAEQKVGSFKKTGEEGSRSFIFGLITDGSVKA